jgi:hypothetical protein
MNFFNTGNLVSPTFEGGLASGIAFFRNSRHAHVLFLAKPFCLPRTMLDEQSIIEIAHHCPAREAASDQVKTYLANRGWLIVERDEFDVAAIHPGGQRVLLKFWIRADKKPVPKFYIKKFDRAVQEFIKENDIKENVTVLFVTNSVLDDEAYAYHRQVGRYTMKLSFAASDIKEQVAQIRQEPTAISRKNVQTQLSRYVSA